MKAAILFIALLGAAAQAGPPQASKPAWHSIDLATALRLAGANNLDVQIARERLAEAEAQNLVALEQFFPYVAPGLSYRRHEGNIQTVEGRIIDADKELYTAGATATAQVDLGEALFRKLAARRSVDAARHFAEAQRQESVLQAALGYFDLARAKAAAGVAAEAVHIAEDYAAQVKQALDAGLAFKGDVYRATTQVERNRLALDRAREQRRLAASRLAQVLYLDPAVTLVPEGGDLAPIELIPAGRSVEALIAEATAARPELKQY